MRNCNHLIEQIQSKTLRGLNEQQLEERLKLCNGVIRFNQEQQTEMYKRNNQQLLW